MIVSLSPPQRKVIIETIEGSATGASLAELRILDRAMSKFPEDEDGEVDLTGEELRLLIALWERTQFLTSESARSIVIAIDDELRKALMGDKG